MMRSLLLICVLCTLLFNISSGILLRGQGTLESSTTDLPTASQLEQIINDYTSQLSNSTIQIQNIQTNIAQIKKEIDDALPLYGNSKIQKAVLSSYLITLRTDVTTKQTEYTTRDKELNSTRTTCNIPSNMTITATTDIDESSPIFKTIDRTCFYNYRTSLTELDTMRETLLSKQSELKQTEYQLNSMIRTVKRYHAEFKMNRKQIYTLEQQIKQIQANMKEIEKKKILSKYQYDQIMIRRKQREAAKKAGGQVLLPQ